MGRGLGILLIQLGTPEAPTPEALRPYLRQFLTDPRVIDFADTLKWRLILRLFTLRNRPAESAAKYRRIWDQVTGSSRSAGSSGTAARGSRQYGMPATAPPK